MEWRMWKILSLLLLMSILSGCARLIHQLESPLPNRTEHKKAVPLPPLEIPPELAPPSVSHSVSTQ
jgi:uncharacterized lipoprotein